MFASTELLLCGADGLALKFGVAGVDVGEDDA
jgi:hypothetical protein